MSSHSDLLTAIKSFGNLTSDPICNYVTNKEFIEEYRNFSRRSSASISIFHLNIRSLNSNNAKLFQLLSGLSNPFEVIVLSEIWSFNITFYSNLFPNFNFFYQLPTTSDIGGIGIYVHNSFKVAIHPFPPPTNSDFIFESLNLEISKNNHSIFISGFYRHPSPTLSKFNNYLEALMLTFFNKFTNIDCICIGDMNANLLDYGLEIEITRFLDIFSILIIHRLPQCLQE